jgi:Fe-S-cluster containining protein
MHSHQTKKQSMRIDIVIPKDTYRPLKRLKLIYDKTDALFRHISSQVSLPCTMGCDLCCNETVFLSELEWWAIAAYIKTNNLYNLLTRSFKRAENIYSAYKPIIDSLDTIPDDPTDATWQSMKKMNYRCPFLEDGACQVYPQRELMGRIYGAGFIQPKRLYGCDKTHQRYIEVSEKGKKIPPLINVLQFKQEISLLPYGNHTQLMVHFLMNNVSRIS